MTDSSVRTYVLDTSVLLSDPWACTRFAEHEVVVPLVVISELEAKRHHHELGWFARQALADVRRSAPRARTPRSAHSRWYPGRHVAQSSSTTAIRRCCPPGSAPTATTPAS